MHNLIIKEQNKFIENLTNHTTSKYDTDKNKTLIGIKALQKKYQNILNIFFSFDMNNNF